MERARLISFTPPAANGMNGSGLANTGVQSPWTTFQAQQPQLPQYDAMGGMGGAAANDAQARAQQMKFMQALQAQAAGTGPSVAQNLLTQGVDRNNAAAASTMAGARGMNPGLAAKMAMDQMGQNNQAGAQSSALLRSQEMLGTQGLLGSALQGMRGQDLSQFGQMAQLGLGQNQQNLQGSLATQGMNEQAQLANLQANLGQQGININKQQADQDFWTKLAGSLAGGLGSVGAAYAGKHDGGQVESWMGNDMLGGASGFKSGGTVPGTPRAAGDSPKNDTVSAKLSPGEIVLPRSVAQADDAPERAAEFVRAIRRKKAAESGEGYGKVLQMRRMSKGGMAPGEVAAPTGGSVSGAPVYTGGQTQQVHPSASSPASPDMDIVKLQHMLAIIRAAGGK